MVVLQDYSGLKRTEKVTVPLNGVNYHCVPELPAGSILDMGGAAAGEIPELPEGVDLSDLATAEIDAETAAKLDKAGGSRLAVMVEFFVDVMEPDSLAQWTLYMRKPPKGLTPAKRKQHLDRQITLPQYTSVFRSLMGHYAGRPTTPPSSSSNGDGGTGGTSTAGAQGAG